MGTALLQWRYAVAPRTAQVTSVASRRRRILDPRKLFRLPRAAAAARAARAAAAHPISYYSAPTTHNDFLWAKILLLHAENLFIDFGAESYSCRSSRNEKF
jgi:hypothetical protein